MNKLFYVAFVALIVSSSCYFSMEEKEIFTKFQDFMKRYNKNYSSIEEFKQKFEIFKQNVQVLDHLRTSNYGSNDSAEYDLGVTEFFDVTPEQFAKTHLNLKMQDAGKLLFNPNTKPFRRSAEDAPASWDWREHGAVGPVKNQGSCGSCWAFSATGNLEGQYAKAHNGTLVQFSEQQLVDCDNIDEGCNGGLMENAFKFLETEGGIELESTYPYKGRRNTCAFSQDKVAAKIVGYKYADSEDEEVIKQFLYENGPLAIAINATPLQFYFGGIFNPWFSKWICNPESLNHGVLIVGYGEEKGKKYWIVKNSWGSGWGEKGYFRIIRGNGTCGVNKYVITAQLE